MIIWYILGGIIVVALVVELVIKDNKYIKFERNGQLVDLDVLNAHLEQCNRKATVDESALISMSSISVRCNKLEKVFSESKDRQGEMSNSYNELGVELEAWTKKYSKKDSELIKLLMRFQKPINEIIKWHSLNWQGTKESEESDKYLASKYGIQKFAPTKQHLNELIAWRKSAATNIINNLPDYMLRVDQN